VSSFQKLLQLQAAAFEKGLESGASEEQLEQLYSRMVEGVGAFESEAKRAVQRNQQGLVK
jgi:uncharacterized phage protein gp47/JayE